MSAEKTTSPCNKFQANFFNKSKCQNCFKSRELHLLNDHDMEQAKPVYGGWLCLAPEGTDFDKPMQRSRKWQRRFFILYEHGSLSFALDELPSTLPQGTLNMNLCTDISDGEPRTGQRNALCIATPEQEVFIRGDNRETISGWSEQLAVYLRTDKQNAKKKRKVEPVATQEPSPAKMAATDPGLGPARGLETTKTPAGDSSAFLSPLVAAEANNTQTSADGGNRDGRPPPGSEAASRTGRTETRSNKREKLQSCGDIVQLTAPLPPRRARSLDRRTSDTVMTPDLLNFKKGWMVKLENEQWKKYWFVLSTDSLRFYKDSMAEEASDLEGEIDLTKCFNVSEFLVQRNYGFQIHTPKGVFTLSAMTSGIRKNWIQALMKNVHPAHAPGVASLPVHHGPLGPPEVLPRPDVTPADPKHRSVMERRREGRYRTFDWAEFRTAAAAADAQRTKAPCSLELGDLERRKRREERRRRYESVLGVSLGWEAGGDKSQRRAEEEVEECWRLVETTVLRLERTVPVFPEDGCRKRVEDLKVQLAESERHRLELEAQLRPASGFQQQPDPPEEDEEPENIHTQTLTDAYNETLELLRQQDAIRQSLQEQLSSGPPPPTPQTPSIWLHDAEGNPQELLDLGPAAEAPLSPASDLFCASDGGTDRPEPEDGEQVLAPLVLEEPAEDQAVVRRLCQEVQLLSSQNQALDQRNQEMLNQLTEADREIERLKAELGGGYNDAPRLPELRQAGLKDLERELGLRNQELLEAQTFISSLEENLKETEALLQLSVPAEEQESGGEREDLLGCLEAKLGQSEAACEELRAQNAELKQAEKLYRRAAAEADADARRLGEELERLKDGRVSAEERIQQVMEAAGARLDALGKILEAMASLEEESEEEEEEEEEEEPDVVTHVKREERLLSSLLRKLDEEKLVSEATERMVVEKQILLLGHDLQSRDGTEDPEVTWSAESPAEAKKPDGAFGLKRARVVAQMKMLHSVAASVSASAHEKLRLMASRLSDAPPHPWSGFIHAAATEALFCRRLSRLQSRHRREKRELGTGGEERRRRPGRKRSASCQTEEVQKAPQDGQEVSALRGRVAALEEELDGRMSSVATRHEKELEKLKVACGRGFASMEESHLKVVEELQRRHQQEVQRLLLERDRLLEEESAATATAIDAVKNAHRLELEREVQKRRQAERSTGDAQLEDVFRRHSDELNSFQRELLVLSQQFSLKCLENGHLVQALDAERKALCQCQQENQDLRTRNQELSGHLAAEITRLCSLAKRDELPLSQGMDAYEMEITLRVKESEVQCLKQEITSLKDELQAAQRDKRNATKKYKDMYTELSIMRAKTERELDELRENLRLAHRALDLPSP